MNFLATIGVLRAFLKKNLASRCQMAHYAEQGREPSLLGSVLNLMIRGRHSGPGPAANCWLITERGSSYSWTSVFLIHKINSFYLLTSKPESISKILQRFVSNIIIIWPFWRVVDEEGKGKDDSWQVIMGFMAFFLTSTSLDCLPSSLIAFPSPSSPAMSAAPPTPTVPCIFHKSLW